MTLLLLTLAAWTFLAVRMIRSRRARVEAAVLADSAPPALAESWGRIDDVQLTRLLRDAARDR